MSFLKDFKEDLSLAVSELLPQELNEGEESHVMEGTSAEKKGAALPLQEKSEKSQERKAEEPRVKGKSHQKHNERRSQKVTTEKKPENSLSAEKKDLKDTLKEMDKKEAEKEEVHLEEMNLKGEIDLGALFQSEPQPEDLPAKDFFPETEVTDQDDDGKVFEEIAEKENIQDAAEVKNKTEIVEEEKIMDELMTGKMETEEFNLDGLDVIQGEELPAPEARSEVKRSSEVATITAGTRINGDIESDGSLEILGTINGNVTCNGKLTITGTIVGNSNADEVYADSAKVEGEIDSEGAVKIGLGSVILGNVKATSAVIAGAIRGDIDVHGPVIVDTSAVVMGNIKSRSVQINNGAVIEGFCSQCYSDVSVKNFFEENKPTLEKKSGTEKKSGADKK